jgi:hypothetical protein
MSTNALTSNARHERLHMQEGVNAKNAKVFGMALSLGIVVVHRDSLRSVLDGYLMDGCTSARADPPGGAKLQDCWRLRTHC